MTIDYELFTQTLKFYLMKHPAIVDEDLIRYWFLCIHNTNPIIEVAYKPNKKQHNYLKINPAHQQIFTSKKACADLYYANTDTVFEFKYHRKTDYSNNCTTTKIGCAFRDLNRLSILDNKEKYFVYVFDNQMRNYFINKDIGSSTPHFYFNTKTITKASKFVINGNNPLSSYTQKEFVKNAFSGFSQSAHSFHSLNYTLEVVYISPIPDTDFILLVYKIR